MAVNDPHTAHSQLRPLAGGADGCSRTAERPVPLLPMEGVLYLTPDGDGYILYAPTGSADREELPTAC